MAPPKSTRTHEDEVLYQRLVNDTARWDMPEIGRVLNVQHQTVKSWRKDSLAAQRAVKAGLVTPHPNALPEPDEVEFGKPIWLAGTIRRWAMQTGRMSADGRPLRSKPPGRPRGATSAVKAA